MSMKSNDEARELAMSALRTDPPIHQFASPIDYIFVEHFRQRMLCQMLDQIAVASGADADSIAAVLDFILDDFAVHIRDEEEDLFPLLRHRAHPDDGIERILARLCEEHAADSLDAEAIKIGLSKALADARLSQKLRRLLHRFAANERRHLTLENAIVLPFARLRLTASDLERIGQNMAARRNIRYSKVEDAS